MSRPDSSRATLRRELRRQRQQLSPGERRQANRRFGRNLRCGIGLRRVRHVAMYQARDAELDPLPALRQRRFRGARWYLPVLDPIYRGRLRFHPWHPGQPLRRNRFNIGEPQWQRARALWALDVILIPLVGFDDAGRRLGMGGGFYDRTLADLARRPRQPRLIGVGYGIQRVQQLPAAPWDRAVDQVITDER